MRSYRVEGQSIYTNGSARCGYAIREVGVPADLDYLWHWTNQTKSKTNGAGIQESCYKHKIVFETNSRSKQ